jgi:hypothetical protein
MTTGQMTTELDNASSTGRCPAAGINRYIGGTAINKFYIVLLDLSTTVFVAGGAVLVLTTP